MTTEYRILYIVHGLNAQQFDYYILYGNDNKCLVTVTYILVSYELCMSAI